MAEEQDSLFTILNSPTVSKIDSDYLRMAVGFLDTDKLMELGPYKSFVALVSMTKGKIRTQRKFQFPVRDVMKEIGITGNNYDVLRDYVKLLMETVLDFNVHRQDRNPGWDMAQILGPSQLKDGVISFEFTEPVWEKLKDPLVYAYITRKGIYSFKSKYDIALYNWFTRLLVPDHSNVITEETIPFILKDILHIEKKAWKTYGSYMRLNDKILKKSIDSINKQTNIHVDYKGLREGRHVTRVRFVVTRSANHQESLKPTLPKSVRTLLTKLVKLGLNSDAKIEERLFDLIELVGEEACIQRLSEIIKEIKSRKESFTNPGGYIRTKIFEDISVPETVVDDELPHQEFIGRYKQFIQQALKSIWSDFVMDHFKQYVSEHFETIQPHLQELCTSDSSFRALTKGNPIDKDALLRSRSLLSVASSKADLLGFTIPEVDKRLWAEQRRDSLLSKSRELFQLDSKLRYEMADVGYKPQELEEKAFIQFINEVE